HQLFCSGHAELSDGRLSMSSPQEEYASEGSAFASILDPTVPSLTGIAPLNVGRYYPTATGLPDGRLLYSNGSKYDYAVFFGGANYNSGSGLENYYNDVNSLGLHEAPVWASGND